MTTPTGNIGSDGAGLVLQAYTNDSVRSLTINNWGSLAASFGLFRVRRFGVKLCSQGPNAANANIMVAVCDTSASVTPVTFATAIETANYTVGNSQQQVMINHTCNCFRINRESELYSSTTSAIPADSIVRMTIVSTTGTASVTYLTGIVWWEVEFSSSS